MATYWPRTLYSATRGIYRHIASGKLYRHVFECRQAGTNSVVCQNQVIYSQLEASVDRDTKQPIRAGTLWCRDKKDFDDKFEPVNTRL